MMKNMEIDNGKYELKWDSLGRLFFHGVTTLDKNKRMTRKKWRIIVWKKKTWNDKMETKMDTYT